MKKKMLCTTLNFILCMSYALMSSMPVFAAEDMNEPLQERVAVESLDEAEAPSGSARLISHPISATLPDGEGNSYAVSGDGLEGWQAAGAITIFSISSYKSNLSSERTKIDKKPKYLTTTATINGGSPAPSNSQTYNASSGSCVAQTSTSGIIVWQIMGYHKVRLYNSSSGPMWQGYSQLAVN